MTSIFSIIVISILLGIILINMQEILVWIFDQHWIFYFVGFLASMFILTIFGWIPTFFIGLAVLLLVVPPRFR
jgi:hypothetical protein